MYHELNGPNRVTDFPLSIKIIFLSIIRVANETESLSLQINAFATSKDHRNNKMTYTTFSIITQKKSPEERQKSRRHK